MGWKTGLHTFGVHYIASLAKTAESIRRIIPDHDPGNIARRHAGEWLDAHAPPDITVQKIMMLIKN